MLAVTTRDEKLKGELKQKTSDLAVFRQKASSLEGELSHVKQELGGKIRTLHAQLEGAHEEGARQASVKFEEIIRGLRAELAESDTKAEVASERAEVAELLVAPLRVATSLLRAEVRTVEREKIAAVDSLMRREGAKTRASMNMMQCARRSR